MSVELNDVKSEMRDVARHVAKMRKEGRGQDAYFQVGYLDGALRRVMQAALGAAEVERLLGPVTELGLFPPARAALSCDRCRTTYGPYVLTETDSLCEDCAEDLGEPVVAGGEYMSIRDGMRRVTADKVWRDRNGALMVAYSWGHDRIDGEHRTAMHADLFRRRYVRIQPGGYERLQAALDDPETIAADRSVVRAAIESPDSGAGVSLSEVAIREAGH